MKSKNTDEKDGVKISVRKIENEHESCDEAFDTFVCDEITVKNKCAGQTERERRQSVRNNKLN